MRRNCAAFLLGLFLWLTFVSTAWTQNGYTWQLGAQMPEGRQELATGALNGKMYAPGGYEPVPNSTPTLQVYNPTTNTWPFGHEHPYPVNQNRAPGAEENINSYARGKGQ